MSANTRDWIPGLQERLIEEDETKKTFFSVGPKGEWQYRYEFAPVTAEVEASKYLQRDDEHWKKGVKQEQVHYAHIPDQILFKWHCEGVDIRDNKALFDKVNSPDWSHLKCVGKIHVPKG